VTPSLPSFAPGVAAVGAGSELCPGAAMAAGRFDEKHAARDGGRRRRGDGAGGGAAMSERFEVATKAVPTMYFIGVTTTKSSIMRVFPLWMQALGRRQDPR
jgi:hypothetical protein